MMIYISVGLCIVGFLISSIAITFIVASGFFGDDEEEKES